MTLPTQTTIGPALMWIGAIIAALRRRRPIGGWLFFFFWQTAVGLAVSLGQIDWSRFAPRAWTDTGRDLAFVLSTAPRVTTLFAVAVMAALLLRTYDRRWLVVLRYVLMVFVVFGVVSVGVDFIWFPERIAMDAASLLSPTAYVVYFFVSTRVKIVFVDRSL